MVLEHLNDPQACFREFNRVCKEGGLVILATPNLLHYSNLVVRLTPYWFHEWFIKAILCGSGGSHPTTYKANTPKKLTSMMEKAGFEKEDVRLLDFGPAYLHWLTPAYAIGMIYHRVVNRFNRLSFLRGTIIGVFSKIATI
jgi:ubiquinone/menaquinone biosynthesis C-methylase UbiE